MIHPLSSFFGLVQHSHISLLGCSNCSSLWFANGLRITQESRKMQASPRVDVDDAPYAPSTDFLYVTELEDAHDSIELLKSDDNPGFFYTETLSISVRVRF